MMILSLAPTLLVIIFSRLETQETGVLRLLETTFLFAMVRGQMLFTVALVMYLGNPKLKSILLRLLGVQNSSQDINLVVIMAIHSENRGDLVKRGHLMILKVSKEIWRY